MARLKLEELAELIRDLPDATVLAKTAAGSARCDDLFLCSLGFEERCLTIPSMLANIGYRADRAVYLAYSTNYNDNNVNLPALQEVLGCISSDVSAIQIDELDSAVHLGNMLRQMKSEALVSFDFSVSSNKTIFRLLRALMTVDIQLRLYYSEAAVYHPTEVEYNADPGRWSQDEMFGIEHGVREVVASTEYPGRHLDPLPNCVVVFPGFKPDRARAAINLVDPALLTRTDDSVKWILGVPHLTEDSWRLSAMRAINEIASDAPQYEVSTFEYKDSLGVLEQIYLNVQDRFNVSLAPFGSKMQALASCLFCHIHPDIRVIFASPKEYDASVYSKGAKALWQLGGESGAR